MNDDPRLPDLDDRLLDAVSAVVDDVADADERALVAASVDAQVWVEHLRALRDDVAGLATITPPAAVRESAFAAALAAFDEVHATTSTPVTDGDPEHRDEPRHPVREAVSGAVGQVVSLAERRRRRARSLLAAAAAVVVLAGVGIAIRAGQGSDDDMAESAATEAPALDESASAKSAPAPMAAAADTAAPAADAAGAATETEAATEAADAAPGGAAEMDAIPSTIGSIDSAASIGTVIGSSDELAAYVTASLGALQTPAPDGTEAPAGTQAPAATEAPAETVASATTTMPDLTTSATGEPNGGDGASCVTDGQVLVGPIVYLGTPAVAVYDPTTGAAIAYDTSDCRLLASITLD